MTYKIINNGITNTILQWFNQPSNNLPHKSKKRKANLDKQSRRTVSTDLSKQFKVRMWKGLSKHVMCFLHITEILERRIRHRDRQHHQISLSKKLGLSLLYLNFLDEKPLYAYYMLKELWRK